MLASDIILRSCKGCRLKFHRSPVLVAKILKIYYYRDRQLILEFATPDVMSQIDIRFPDNILPVPVQPECTVIQDGRSELLCYTGCSTIVHMRDETSIIR